MKKIVTTDGQTILRVSRWISIRHAYDASKRHSLAYYITDGYGRRSNDPKYDPSAGTYLDYFVWGGKKWALDQFLRCGSMFCPTEIRWEENGEIRCIAGIDAENYINPIMIELDECCEHVRVYREE